MELNVIAAGITESGKRLEIGDKARYRYHVPGGMVKIKLADGSEEIAHPACFAELR